MQPKEPIAIMIHDMNPWGGQDRSMLEIAWRLNQEFPLEIHSFTLEGYDNWPNMEHVKYYAKYKNLILLKYLNYHFNSWRNLRNNPKSLVQSTGTASLNSSVVQVQFIHHTWQNLTAKMPPDKVRSHSLLNNSYHSFLNRYKKEMERLIYKPDKKYIAISHGIKKELMEHFEIPQESIDIIYHGVDSKHFHPWQDDPQATQTRQEVRTLLGLQDNDFALLHVGALHARKGLFKSLKVLSFLKKHDFKNIKLVAVGGGDQKKLIEASRELDVEDRLILAPHSKEIRNYYWAADCFFFPTFYEPFGMVILEAMACGLPTVTSEAAGASELIKEGENGLLFDPWGTPQEIANSLLPLLRDPNLGKQLALQGRRTAEKQTWEKVGQKYIEFYKRLQKGNDQA